MTTDLVRRAQTGDRDAFEALIRTRYDRLYAVATRILRDATAGEDAVQDAVIVAWRDLRGLRDPERFDAWLHRLVVNGCRDELRRSRRRARITEILPIDRPSADASERMARRDELDRAFRTLSIEHRAVLVLTHYAGFGAPEIASILGIPVGTVYSRIHNATAAMRRAIVGRQPATDPQPEPSR